MLRIHARRVPEHLHISVCSTTLQFFRCRCRGRGTKKGSTSVEPYGHREVVRPIMRLATPVYGWSVISLGENVSRCASGTSLLAVREYSLYRSHPDSCKSFRAV